MVYTASSYTRQGFRDGLSSAGLVQNVNPTDDWKVVLPSRANQYDAENSHVLFSEHVKRGGIKRREKNNAKNSNASTNARPATSVKTRGDQVDESTNISSTATASKRKRAVTSSKPGAKRSRLSEPPVATATPFGLSDGTGVQGSRTTSAAPGKEIRVTDSSELVSLSPPVTSARGSKHGQYSGSDDVRPARKVSLGLTYSLLQANTPDQ